MPEAYSNPVSGIFSNIQIYSELYRNLVYTTVPYLKPLAHLEPEVSSNVC